MRPQALVQKEHAPLQRAAAAPGLTQLLRQGQHRFPRRALGQGGEVLHERVRPGHQRLQEHALHAKGQVRHRTGTAHTPQP